MNAAVKSALKAEEWPMESPYFTANVWPIMFQAI